MPAEYQPRDGSLAVVARHGAEHVREALTTLLQRDMSVVRSSATSIELDDDRDELLGADTFADGSANLGRLAIDGPPSGAAWVGFTDHSVQQIAGIFGLEDASSEDSRSMLAEVANIVAGSYLTVLGDTWGVELNPTPADLDSTLADMHAELDALEGDPSGSRLIALGCEFSDDDGHYDMSVLLLLRESRDAVGAVQEEV